MKAHHWLWVKGIGRYWCVRCLHLQLKNDKSRRTASKSCEGSDPCQDF